VFPVVPPFFWPASITPLATRRLYIGVNRRALLVFQAGRSRASSGPYCHQIYTKHRLSQAGYPYYSRS